MRLGSRPCGGKNGFSGSIENRFSPDHSQIRCRGRHGGVQNPKTVQEAFETIVANAKNYQSDVKITGVLVQNWHPGARRSFSE